MSVFIKHILAKLGNYTDLWTHTKTLLGFANASYQHIHMPALCYPTLLNGISISTGAGAWELGAFTEIIPANEISDPFDIHWIIFESASANGIYELHLFSGLEGSEELIGKVRTEKYSNQLGASNVPIQVPVISHNSRITAKLASDDGGRSVSVSVFYHTYE